MGQVHQVQPALGLDLGGAGVHQHVRKSGGRAAAHHRQREEPDRGPHLPRQREGQRHEAGRQGQRNPAEGHPQRRGQQHGANCREGGEQHQEPQPRFIHPQHGLEVRQGRGKAAPEHPHGGEGRDGGAGGGQGGGNGLAHAGLLDRTEVAPPARRVHPHGDTRPLQNGAP